MTADERRLFELLDDYSRSLHQAFVAELSLDKSQTKYIVCFRPATGDRESPDRYACRYLHIDADEARTVVLANALTRSLTEKLNAGLATLGKLESDKSLLAKVISIEEKRDYIRTILLNDSFDDWERAQYIGRYLVGLGGTLEVVGRAILVKAHRYLGNRQAGLDELKQCRHLIESRRAEPSQAQTLLGLLVREEVLLSTGPAGAR